MIRFRSYSTRKPTSQLRRNLLYSILDGVLAVPNCFLAIPGNLVMTVLLTRYFHLSIFQFGMIVSLQAACNTLQLGVIPRLNHHYSPKQLNVFAASIQWGAFLLLATSLWILPTSGSTWVFPFLLILFFILASMQATQVVAWSSWVQEFVPERIRGNFFGRRNRIFYVFTVVYVLSVGLWLDHFKQGDVVTLRNALIVLIGVSMLIRIGSILFQYRTWSPSDLSRTLPLPKRRPTRPWIDQLQPIFKQSNLRAYFIFGAVFGFCSNLMGPFFTVFMLDVLQMTSLQVTTMVVMSSLAGALTLPEWGRMTDRFGNRPVAVFCLVAWMVDCYLWIFTAPGRLWILYIAWFFGGVFAVGFGQSLFGLLLKIIPSESKTVVISINTAITAIPAVIAPMIGGGLLDVCVKHGWNKLTVYQCGSAVHHTLILLTVLVLLRIKEPRAQPIGQLIGAMRSYRQIAAMLGLSFFTNYIFYRKK